MDMFGKQSKSEDNLALPIDEFAKEFELKSTLSYD